MRMTAKDTETLNTVKAALERQRALAKEQWDTAQAEIKAGGLIEHGSYLWAMQRYTEEDWVAGAVGRFMVAHRWGGFEKSAEFATIDSKRLRRLEALGKVKLTMYAHYPKRIHSVEIISE